MLSRDMIPRFTSEGRARLLLLGAAPFDTSPNLCIAIAEIPSPFSRPYKNQVSCDLLPHAIEDG